MVFEIPSTLNATDVHVQFLGTNPITGTYVNASGGTQSLVSTKGYSLAEITGTVSVSPEAFRQIILD